MDLAVADRLANEILELLTPACTRIAIAGSIRRRKPNPKDIEVVCIPRLDYPPPQRDLFGNVATQPPPSNALDLRATELLSSGYFAHRRDKNERQAFGQRYKRLLCNGIGLDLFSVVPCTMQQWGNIFTIRTGCMEFSHRLVTSRLAGGWMPPGMIEKGGALWDRGRMLDTPEEQDFFAAIGVPWLEPERRTPHVTLMRNSANSEGRWV